MLYTSIKEKYSRIIFWEPSWSPHKSEFIASVAKKLSSVKIIYIADRNISDARIKMGWNTPIPDGYELIISPDENEINNIFRSYTDSTFHVLSGMRTVPCIVNALHEIKKTNADFAVMSEPRVLKGLLGKLRYLQSILTENWIRKNTKFVLAIGRNGPAWFSSVGYSTKKIFPFGYFVNSPRTLSRIENAHIEIGYLGRITKEKGVYDIIDACKLLTHPYRISIAGDGVERQALSKYAKQKNIAVEFKGIIPMSETALYLQKLDVLILASTTKDGWGVVISEALMVGTAVIASKEVGASLLLDNKYLGYIVPPKSPKLIKNAIDNLYQSHSFTMSSRQKRVKWSEQSIVANAGAQYFLEILNWTQYENAKTPCPFHKKHTVK